MGVFWLLLLIPHSHRLEVRAREWEGESKTSQAGMTLLHNVCCCCMTRLVTLRITATQSNTKRCVWETERDGCWEGGLQCCPWVSEGIVIDCAAVAFNYVSIQSMQKATGAKVTFLHSDYSCLLCGSTVLCFHPSVVFLNWIFPSAWACGLIHLGDAQCHRWEKPKRCVWEKSQGLKMCSYQLKLRSLYKF